MSDIEFWARSVTYWRDSADFWKAAADSTKAVAAEYWLKCAEREHERFIGRVHEDALGEDAIRQAWDRSSEKARNRLCQDVFGGRWE